MSPSHNNTMTAEEALIAYGYREVNGLFQRGLTEAWKRDEDSDGFLMLRPGGPAIGSADGTPDPAAGAPWGIPAEGAPGWVQVPFKQLDRYSTISGAHPLTHPEMFEWIWPADEVAERYEFASPNGDNPYVRIDGILVHRDDIAE